MALSAVIPIATYAIFNSSFFILFIKAIAEGLRGKVFSSFLKSVIECSAILLLKIIVAAFKSFTRFVVLIGTMLFNPYKYFAISTRCTRLFNSAQLNFFCLIAFFTLEMAAGTSPGKQSKSFPAIKDCTLASPSGKNFFTPCISNASVNVKPI